MNATVLARTDWLVFPLIAVVLFTGLFALTVLWICRRGARSVYRRRSLLVFDDGAIDGRPRHD